MIKDITVRFSDGIGIKTRGETILDTSEGTYIVLGNEPGTALTFFTHDLTYIAESKAEDDEVAPVAQQQGNSSGMFR